MRYGFGIQNEFVQVVMIFTTKDFFGLLSVCSIFCLVILLSVAIMPTHH